MFLKILQEHTNPVLLTVVYILRPWKLVESAIAGGVAGIIADSLMHPLDTINTRCKVGACMHNHTHKQPCANAQA